MKNMKRIAAVLLALIMVMSLAACGEKVDPTDAPKATEATKSTDADKATEAPTAGETEASFDAKEICEGVTLTIAVADTIEVVDWNTALVTQKIEEALGVNLEFTAYASADFYDKINVMVNGGDKLPDIIFAASSTAGIPATSFNNWAEQGAIIATNDFYADPNYAHYTNLASEQVGKDIPSMLKDAEGNIWGIASFLQFPTNEVPAKFWCNMEYLNKLGYAELPSTVEEFYEMCEAFQAAGDVNGNGLDDEVCLTGRGDNMRWFKMLMSQYVYAWDDYYLDVENGELTFAYTTDEWKAGLKMIKKFFDAGMIDTSALTQNKASYDVIVTDIANRVLADVGYYPSAVTSDAYEQRLARLKYDYMAGFVGEGGRCEAIYIPAISVLGAAITADCENPEAAFLVCDYMFSEEISIMNRYGERGVDWDYWDDVQESLLAEPIEAYTGREKNMFPEPMFVPYSDGTYWGKGNPQNAGYMQHGPMFISADIYWGCALIGNNVTGDEKGDAAVAYYDLTTQSIKDALDAVPKESVITLPMTGDESADVTKVQLTLDSYVTESIGAFLTGEWDIDSYWDTYLAELEKIGIDDALAIYQTSFDRTK